MPLPAAVPADPPSRDYALSFADEFTESAIRPERWNYRTEIKALSAQVPANNVIDHGQLNLLMKREPSSGKAYTAGGLVSKRSFRFGYFEARVRFTDNQGWWNAFWLMNGDGTSSSAAGRFFEIDAVEVDTRDRARIMSGLMIWNGEPGPEPEAQPLCSERLVPRIDTSASYHVYGVEWLEGQVRFSLDNQVYCVLEYPANLYRQDAVNVWLTSLAWAEPVRIGGSPQLFDYFRYYQRDYYLNAGDPGFATYGRGWSDSALAGFGGNPQRRSCLPGDSARWSPDVQRSGRFGVRMWTTRDANTDKLTQVSVAHAGGVTRLVVDQSIAPSGWRDLGTFDFDAASKGFVEAKVGSGCVRAGMIKLVRM